MRPLSLAVLYVSMATIIMSNAGVSAADDVIRMDKLLNKFIVEKKSKEAAPLFADDYILITSRGAVVTKKEILVEIASPELKYETLETTNTKVRAHGNTAVLTGILVQKYTYNGSVAENKVWITNTWIKTGDGWKILSGHACLYIE